MPTKTRNKGFWNFVNNFEGDKVTWMIALLLIMISILAISSSTPLLALKEGSTRIMIIREHLIVASIGILIIIGIYNIRRIWFFRFFSQFGYVFSLFLLAYLALHIELPFFKAAKLNNAYRVINIYISDSRNIQIHVFEIVKIVMIMYLAWAVDTYNKDDFKIANLLAKTKRLAFMGKDFWKKAIYIYIPIISVCVLIIGGSMSSALFIGMVMVITILVGGIKVKELIPFVFIVGILLAGCVGIHYISDGKYFTHIGTAVNRIGNNPEKELKAAVGTKDFQKALDKYKQPISAKIAVSEGGIIGKGPGKSTQRYIVPIMFEDYMFAFIIEEYGIFGAIIVLILYGSLLARGSIIIRNCGGIFAKTAIAGLVLLISGQALLHMMINVDLGPLTGQTLPMISYGKNSFIMFSLAFGIILSISRMAKKKIEQEAIELRKKEKEAEELRASMEELRELEEMDLNN